MVKLFSPVSANKSLKRRRASLTLEMLEDRIALTLYGVTWSSHQLITIDETTGAGTLVGTNPFIFHPPGIAFRGNQLYSWDDSARKIVEIDAYTGNTLNTIDIGALPLNNEGDLTFRADGIGFMSDWTGLRFYRFDITLPNSTLIGTLPVRIDGLAFSPGGVLYGMTEGTAALYTVDPATAVVTLVGTTGLNFGASTVALAFDASGNLYAAGGPLGGISSLYRVDIGTGAATLIGSIGIVDVSGITFGTPGPRLPAGVTITQTSGSTDITEGGATDTYTLVLDCPPLANVTVSINAGTQTTVVPAPLTFTTANWNIPRTVTVTAVNDVLVEGPHIGTITHSATSTDPYLNGVAIASVTANITDNDVLPAVLAVESAGSTNVGEGGSTDTYSLVLSTLPTANVVVSVNPGGQTTVAPAPLTFTPVNWSVPQTVTVTANDDAVFEGPHTGTIAHSATSADPNYNGIAIGDIIANITDNDAAGITLNQVGGTLVAEGGGGDSYTIVLNSQPTANVTITLGVGPQLAAGPTVLTFVPAAWNTPQTVTVTAVDDFVAEGNHSDTISHTSSSGDANYNALVIASITASITDNDTAGVNIVPSGGATNLTEGGAIDTYTAVLTSQPTANVVLTLSPNSQVMALPTTLTFTPLNWNVALSVTVTAVDDAVFEGPHTGLIAHTASSGDPGYNALAIAALTAGITDNDTPGLAFSPVSLGLSEGGSASSYTVTLTSQPTADVVVSLNAGTQFSLASAAALTFTAGNWSAPRTLTVTAVDDFLAEGPHSGMVTHSATSTDPNYILTALWTASIIDNDFPGVTLSTASLTMLEGASRTYTVVLDLPPTADVVVTLSPGSLLSVTPTALTFTAASWNIPQVVAVTATDDAILQGSHTDTISHTATSADPAYSAIAIPAVTAAILDNDGLVINGTSQPDKIRVTNSADLSSIYVSVNGKTTSYPSTLSQMVISSSGGADDIQIYNPIVPIVIVGGQQNDKVLVAGHSPANAISLDDTGLTVNGIYVGLFEVENAIAAGNLADDVFTVHATPGFNVEFRGDQGNDQLQGADRPNTWRIVNPNAGTLNTSIKFTAVENLTGGSTTDGFFFNAGRTISGVIDGGAGNNKLDYALYSSPITANVQAGTATGLRSFQNIGQVVGGKSSLDRIIGRDQSNLWNITDLNAGNVNGMSFQNIENLTGGQLDDTFRIGDNRGLKGKIDGGGGSNTLDYSSYLSKAASINLQSQLATNLAGFDHMQTFQGGSGIDTLIGANLINVWNLTGSNTGTVNGLNFAAFENLTGGIKNDSFTLAAAANWTGLLNGGTGSDTLNSFPGSTYTNTTLGAGLLNGRKFQGIESRR